jgi:hypothetical protein
MTEFPDVAEAADLVRERCKRSDMTAQAVTRLFRKHLTGTGKFGRMPDISDNPRELSVCFLT